MSDKLQDLKILLVEDQKEARVLIRGMLSELGITQVFDASNGRDALAFLDSAFDFIDLIICDWNMPEMSGLQLLQQLRSVDPHTPFLMVTGRADLESVVEAKSYGVTGYISKPLSAKQLEAKLRVLQNRIV